MVRGRPRKELAPPPPILVGENSQSDNFDMPDKTEATHSETPNEADYTNNHDSVLMSETPLNDDREVSFIKSKSSVDTVDGVSQRLKFDGETFWNVWFPRDQGDKTCEANALFGESFDRKNVRFLPDPGDGVAAVVSLEVLVEDYCSDEHGQGQMLEGLQFKVEPDQDTSSTEVAVDRFLQNGVARQEQLSTRWEEIWRKRNTKWEYKVRHVGREPEASYSLG